MLRKGYTHFLVTVNILTILKEGGIMMEIRGREREGRVKEGIVRGGEKRRNGIRVREGEVGGRGDEGKTAGSLCMQ